MANTTAKFTADVDVACRHVQGLYLCGPDIGLTGTASHIQGGWLAANAVLGYDLKDDMWDLGDETRDLTRDLRCVL